MVNANATQTYDAAQSRKMIKGIDKFLLGTMPDLTERYGAEDAQALRARTLEKFEELIPDIPYIGGKANRFTLMIVQAAGMLAFYRAMQERGGSLEETNEIMIEGAKKMFNAYPKFLRYFLGRLKFNRWAYARTAAGARTSQQRTYPGDWVWSYIDGDGESFDYGIDFEECGIVKFMEAQGAPELTPYLCETDYMMAEAFGMSLVRTETIASGCERCNFRFSAKQS